MATRPSSQGSSNQPARQPARFAAARRALLAVLALPALLAPAAPVARADDPQPVFAHAAAIDARVAEVMSEQTLVGVGVAVAIDGDVRYARGYGLADREAGVAVDPAATLFRWASISKPITAVRAMQLWEQGKLDLDADVRGLVPEFPEKPFPITARQLLCHQGGIVHYRNGRVVRTVREYDVEHPFVDLVVGLDAFKESPLVCEPGTRMSYTTHGYMLLGAVVERAGKASFASQVDAHIAEPLGMSTLAPDYQWVDLPDRAKGYRKALGLALPSTDTDVSWKLAGGGFVSSVADLARFGAGMLEHRLVKPETRALLWEDQKTRDGKATGYGLGFNVERRGKRLLAMHGGAQEGTSTFLILDAHARVAVGIMSNTEGAKLGPLGRALLDVVGAPASEPAPSTPAPPTTPGPGGPRPREPRAPREPSGSR